MDNAIYTRFKTEQGATGQGREILGNPRVNVMVGSLGRMFLTSANMLLFAPLFRVFGPLPLFFCFHWFSSLCTFFWVDTPQCHICPIGAPLELLLRRYVRDVASSGVWWTSALGFPSTDPEQVSGSQVPFFFVFRYVSKTPFLGCALGLPAGVVPSVIQKESLCSFKKTVRRSKNRFPGLCRGSQYPDLRSRIR